MSGPETMQVTQVGFAEPVTINAADFDASLHTVVSESEKAASKGKKAK